MKQKPGLPLSLAPAHKTHPRQARTLNAAARSCSAALMAAGSPATYSATLRTPACAHRFHALSSYSLYTCE